MKFEMKKKILFTKEKREITTKQIAVRLMQVMRDHIGYDNAISKPSLYQEVFNLKFSDDDAGSWIRWEFVKKAMHKLRLFSNCFIISTRDHNNKVWLFVVDDMNDANYYINHLENNIKKMAIMQRKVVISVKEKWAHQPWQLTTPKKLLK